MSTSSGTDGSNPAPSTGESGANLIFALTGQFPTHPPDASGLSVPGQHANEYGGRALHRFGPRGLAAIVFAVLVLDEKLPGNDTIMLTAGWTVLLSVVAHGVTANPLVKRIAVCSAELAA